METINNGNQYSKEFREELGPIKGVKANIQVLEGAIPYMYFNLWPLQGPVDRENERPVQ